MPLDLEQLQRSTVPDLVAMVMQLLQRVDALERENATLREENAKLKTESASLKEQLRASKRARLFS